MTNPPYDGSQNPGAYPPAGGQYPTPYQPQPYNPQPAPMQQYGAYGANQYATNPYPAKKPTSGLAIAGFVLSLVGIFTCWLYGVIPLVALVLSAIGMKDTKDGVKQGRGMAIAGLSISIIVVSLTALLFLAAFYDWFTTPSLYNYPGYSA